MTAYHLFIHFDPCFEPFLKRRGKRNFTVKLSRRTTVCDTIEALGVPHTEIGNILCQSKPVSFNHIPRSSMNLEIMPVRPPMDVCRPSWLRPSPFTDLKFVVDENVAKLASLLRILGLDATYTQGIDDHEIARTAVEENRVLLSKDILLFKRKAVVFGHFVRALRPLDQLREIVDFFVFPKPFRPFSRCLTCNTELVPVEKADILHRLEPKTKTYFHDFKLCTKCDRIVWKGSHHDHMIASLKSVGIDL